MDEDEEFSTPTETPVETPCEEAAPEVPAVVQEDKSDDGTEFKEFDIKADETNDEATKQTTEPDIDQLPKPCITFILILFFVVNTKFLRLELNNPIQCFK